MCRLFQSLSSDKLQPGPKILSLGWKVNNRIVVLYSYYTSIICWECIHIPYFVDEGFKLVRASIYQVL